MILRLSLLGLFYCQTLLAADTYTAYFQARFEPAAGQASASIEIKQDRALLRQLDLDVPASQYSDFSGDGEIERRDDRVIWNVPAKGGSLKYQVKIDHRKGDGYDARMTKTWAILRLDDLFPPARIRALKGAVSKSSMRLQGPAGWDFESRYGPVDIKRDFVNEGRSFDRPSGWMAAGKLGIRRDLIRDTRVVLAGPPGQGMRRLDTLAFLRWTLPRLLKVFDQFPERLLIVGARDEMWRGGLSGPGSLYMHTERPLISENATSTLLHELIHVATGSARKRDDWLVEGLAEYYSLEILRRSGGISQQRYELSIKGLSDWADRENGQLRSPSSGPHTARAVLLLCQLDEELKQNDSSLDHLVEALVSSKDITGQNLLALSEQALEAPSSVLARALEK